MHAPGTFGRGGRVCGRARGSWERVQNGDCGASPTFRVTVDVRGAFISEGPPRLFLLLGWLLFYETLAAADDDYNIIILYMRRCRGRRDDDGLSAAACPREPIVGDHPENIASASPIFLYSYIIIYSTTEIIIIIIIVVNSRPTPRRAVHRPATVA